MAQLGSPKCFGQFCGQRTGADGHLVGEKPGLTRARVRAGGSHCLDDAQGPGVPHPCTALPGPLGCEPGEWAPPLGPWQGESSAEAGGRQAWCGPCPSGECLVAGWN